MHRAKISALVSAALYAAAFGSVLAFRLWHWLPMLGLVLLLVGLRHPPASDRPPFRLGTTRHVLGWIMLLFIFLGLTPTPIKVIGL